MLARVVGVRPCDLASGVDGLGIITGAQIADVGVAAAIEDESWIEKKLPLPRPVTEPVGLIAVTLVP